MSFRYPLSRFPLSLVLALIFGVFLLYAIPCAAGQTAVVTVEAVNIRSGPGTNYEIINQAGLGDRLTVLDSSGDWYKVTLGSGDKGCVANWLVNIEQAQASDAPAMAQPQQAEPVAPAPAQSSGGQVAVIKGSYVNIRSGPGTSSEVVAQAGSGDRFPVLDKSGEWYKVRLSSDSAGWVAGWLVTVEAVAPTPVPAPAVSPAIPSPGVSQISGKVAVVTGISVNVRTGPNTSSGIYGQVTEGEKLTILEQSGDWYRVKLPSGTAGWVAGWLVSVQAAPASQLSPEPVGTAVAEQPQAGIKIAYAGQGNAGGSATTQSGKALSLKVNDLDNVTSTVVVTDTPFEYTSFSMDNPDRLVVDLKGVFAEDLPLNSEVNSKSVRQVRIGQFQKNPDITRLVIELLGGAQYSAALSTDKKTLTVQTYIPDINGSLTGKVIAIDPGHGGPDPGATGSKGTKEKEVNLDVAKRVAKLLEARGAKVIMARAGDQDIGLYERTTKANSANACLFVSIHNNANSDPSFGGTSTYIYNGAGTKVSSAQTARILESKRLALYVQAELLKTLGLRDAGVRDANFAVLRTSNAPAILAELAFLSNLNEEKLMNTDDFRNKAAEAIVRGIGLYFSERRTA